MLNKYVRSTIIVTFQFILPAMLLLILVPQCLNHTHQLSQAKAFFNAHHFQFLLAHSSFYLVLFLLWPLIIKSLTNNPETQQIKIALSARWYLIAIMAFFELLVWWK